MTHDAHDLDARGEGPGGERPPVDLEAHAAAMRADPQPVWRTLDLARAGAFTGEVVFEASPEVRAYFDRGEVYYAEPAGVPPIGQRLVDAGVVDVGQLRRGTVRVGDVEHLGRLFDRESTVDRDAAVLVVERETEAAVAAIADDRWPIRVSPYRHHPSGIHRWFVAPVQRNLARRPVSAVAQVDRTVTEELPTLGTGARHARIEWDEPGPFDGMDVESGAAGFDLDAEWERFDLDEDGVESSGGAPTGAVTVGDPFGRPPTPTSGIDEAPTGDASATASGAEVGPTEDDFQLVWPDGTEETPLPLPPTVLEELQADEPDVDTSDVLLVVDSFVRFDVGTAPSGRRDAEPPSATADESSVRDDLPPVPAAMPEDIAVAVRRALSAIEAVSAGAALRSTLPPIDLDDVDHVDRTDEALPPPAGVPLPPPAAPAAGLAPPTPPSFAPPTPETSAEALYARGEVVSGWTEGESPGDGRGGGEQGEGAAAPVVFLDDDTGGDERSGALRRLIRSLRRRS